MGANLTGAVLTGANLSGSNFRNANFTGASLTGATFSNSNLMGATGLSTATLTTLSGSTPSVRTAATAIGMEGPAQRSGRPATGSTHRRRVSIVKRLESASVTKMTDASTGMSFDVSVDLTLGGIYGWCEGGIG